MYQQNKADIGGTMVCYGTKQNYFDLDYVFGDEMQFSSFTQDISELHAWISAGGKAVICGHDKSSLKEQFVKQYGEGCCVTDDDVIETLNFPLRETIAGKRFFVWGTGYWCDRFMEWMDHDIEISGFIDSDSGKLGKQKYGYEIFSPDVLEKDDFVAVATNHLNFREIEKNIKGKMIPREGYESIHHIMDDVAEYFREVYISDVFYDATCRIRDRHIRIRSNGDVNTCCLASKSNYGNFYLSDFELIWNSKRARISRLSLDKHTYNYCDKERCNYLCGKNVQKREKDFVGDVMILQEYPESIAPEVDSSCNLCCRSCRNQVFIDSSDERKQYADTVIEKIVPLPVRIIINTVGEPFASKNSMYIIRHPKMIKNGNLAIYTNATLLTEERLDELLDKYNVLEFSVSVDAASKETYEKLRKGGNFDTLMRNLSGIASRRRLGKVSYFQLNFTVQNENVSELEDFVRLSESLNADCVVMQAIENWGHLDSCEYDEMSITDAKGEIKEKYRQYFTKYVLTSPIVNFGNLSNALGVVTSDHYML